MNEIRYPSRKKGMDEAERREIVTIAQGLHDWNNLLGRQFGPLSRPQRRMLSLLHREEGVRVSDLGEQLGLTTAGTTRMLDKLEALGYASRTRDQASDQRQVYATLTSAGQQALYEADEIFFERVQATVEVLDQEERATLAHLLHKMHGHVLAPTSLSEK
jgi:DNA-binding MarR family transcriptional regulator